MNLLQYLDNYQDVENGCNLQALEKERAVCDHQARDLLVCGYTILSNGKIIASGSLMKY